jgi:hypothetical protein
MPAWALSQAIFFFLLALPFNLINAIVSVPLFYIFHPLAGFVYYGFRAIEAYEQKQPKNFYYAIFSGFLLVALNLFYMGLQYKGIENYYNPLYFLKASLLNFLNSISFFPFFTAPLVLGTLIISLIIMDKKNENDIFIPYLFFLSVFFLIPAIASTQFIIGTRILPFFLIYLMTKIKNDRRKEISFLFSIFFGLALLLIILFHSIFNSNYYYILKGFPDITLSFCKDILSEKIINITNKYAYLVDNTYACKFNLLNFRDLHGIFIIPGHPVSHNRNRLDSDHFLANTNKLYSDNLLDFCKYFNVAIITSDKDDVKKALLLFPYIGISDFKDFYVIKPCKNDNYKKIKK